MKLNKLTRITISLCFIIGIFPIISFADGWDGITTAEPNRNEAGTYLISNAEELAWFANNSKNEGSKNAVLTNDIDLENHSWLYIIGESNTAPYSGSFDGNGHTVHGLNMNASSNYTGFFGYVTGSILNLTVSGSVTNTSNSSSSYTGGIAAYNTGSIENCISDITLSGKGYVGGIAGKNEGTISKCTNLNTVTTSSSSGTGGIAGENNDGIITKSANYGVISNTSSSGGRVGGIAGFCGGSAEISLSYNTADITPSAECNNVGGIAGYIQGSSVIENVYNLGNVSGKNYIGGIAGYLYGLKSMKNVYSVGQVSCFATSRAAVGGIGNYGFSTSVMKYLSNCYFLKSDDVNTSISAVQGKNTDNVCSKTESEMKSADFINCIGDSFEADSTLNNGYPILSWQKQTAGKEVRIDGELLQTNNIMIASGTHIISADYSSIGNQSENGRLIMAVYQNDGKLDTVLTSSETYSISSEYNLADGAIVKIMFWNNILHPETEPIIIQSSKN